MILYYGDSRCRAAGLIHYAIGDSAPTLRVGPHHTRAPPGRGTDGVLGPRARGRGGPASLGAERCAAVGVTTWGGEG